jgi:hypothetical protein
MRVIGVGFGRTGTASVKLALERLGLGPCYHMSEVIERPQRAGDWLAATRHPVDWDRMFAGYLSTVDWPGAAFWRELLAAYPDAMVLLTVRDTDSWYRSCADTIFRTAGRLPDAATAAAGALPAGFEDFVAMTQAVVVDRVFGGRIDDRDHAVAVYERHNAAVRAEVPAGRLLEYRAADGWGPLCDRLGVPVPDEPFPHVNDTAAFRRRQDARFGGDTP